MIIAKKKYYSFAFENTQNVIIFSVKVIFVERELSVLVDLLKSSIENLLRETFGGHYKENFCPSLFNTYSEEILGNIRILQRRGGILSLSCRLFWSSR